MTTITGGHIRRAVAVMIHRVGGIEAIETICTNPVQAVELIEIAREVAGEDDERVTSELARIKAAWKNINKQCRSHNQTSPIVIPNRILAYEKKGLLYETKPTNTTKTRTTARATK